jgi:two-component system KDP operon response regulator KdpE
MGRADEAQVVVLCVDDDESNRTLMTKLFARNRPLDAVMCADSGETALELARASPPRLVLLDLGLPDMSGEEVLRKLKQGPAVAVIVISGHADEVTRRRVLDHGADGYITKPFQMTELFSLIDRLI